MRQSGVKDNRKLYRVSIKIIIASSLDMQRPVQQFRQMIGDGRLADGQIRPGILRGCVVKNSPQEVVIKIDLSASLKSERATARRSSGPAKIKLHDHCQLSVRNCAAGRPAALNRLQPSGKFTQA
jgi:hypothetical protein